MVKSGYKKIAHKHADDLSFMIYSKGNEIFTDCGMYSYRNDKYRTFLASAKGHNTLIVDEQSYLVSNDINSRTGIQSYEFFNDYDHIRLFNDSYFSPKLTRDFCSCGDLTVIYDYSIADEEHNYSQIFHLAENIGIISSNKNETVLSIADTGYYVIIKQINDVDNLEVIHGDKEKGNYGIVSRYGGHLDEIITLKYNKKTQNVKYVTIIAIVDGNGNIQLDNTMVNKNDIEYKNGIVSFSNKVTISRDNLRENENDILREYGEIPLIYAVKSATCNVEGNEITCDLCLRDNSDYNKYEYGFFLMDDKDNIIKRTKYQKEHSIKFTINVPGIYWIKYWLKTDEHRKSFRTERFKIE